MTGADLPKRDWPGLILAAEDVASEYVIGDEGTWLFIPFATWLQQFLVAKPQVHTWTTGALSLVTLTICFEDDSSADGAEAAWVDGNAGSTLDLNNFGTCEEREAAGSDTVDEDCDTAEWDVYKTWFDELLLILDLKHKLTPDIVSADVVTVGVFW